MLALPAQVVVAAAAIAGTGAAPAADGGGELGDARALRILYAGVPGDARETAFVEFLREHFESVGSIAVEKLSTATAAGYDVVVADGNRLYPMDPKNPSIDLKSTSLGPDFTRPIVMISAQGGTIQHHTKIDWL